MPQSWHARIAHIFDIAEAGTFLGPVACVSELKLNPAAHSCKDAGQGASVTGALCWRSLVLCCCTGSGRLIDIVVVGWVASGSFFVVGDILEPIEILLLRVTGRVRSKLSWLRVLCMVPLCFHPRAVGGGQGCGSSGVVGWLQASFLGFFEKARTLLHTLLLWCCACYPIYETQHRCCVGCSKPIPAAAVYRLPVRACAAGCVSVVGSGHTVVACMTQGLC